MDKEEIYQDLITRYLTGSTSEDENSQLLEWLKGDNHNMKLFVQLRDIWEYSGSMKKNDVETELALIFFKNRITKAKKFPFNQRSRLVAFGKIAAVFIIALLIGYLLAPALKSSQPLTYNETIIPYGQKGMIKLSDGTKVWLNSGSKLRYSANFSKTKRDVFLEGEGYFDVAHDPSSPFYLHTKDLIVKVLGTSFNVKAYPDEGKVETTLVNGSIKILKSENNKYFEITTLKPYDQAIFNVKNNTLVIKKLKSETQTILPTSPTAKNKIASALYIEPKIESVIQWKDQKLIFDNEAFKDIVVKLERWYGRKIYVENLEKNNSCYSGKFEYNETIYQVLDVISRTTNMDYYEKNHNIYIKLNGH